MEFTYVKYINDWRGNPCYLDVVCNGVNLTVPIEPSNRHYAEIIKQVEVGNINILPADE